MNDQIRHDLEFQCREKLERPELRVIAIESIPEGHSGFTYFVGVEDRDGPRRYVLRLPPPGARIAGPADVVRQGRIMSALHEAALPTPAIPAMSADPVVDGRPFILMEAIDGARIETAAAEHKALDIAASAVTVLKHLHELPLDQTGIGDEESVGLQAEMMRVYREHGMSPFSPIAGCLPMLLPMPIFFTLLFVFQNTIEFRGVPFLWLHDISVKDPYYILPLIMGASAFVLSWIGLRNSPPNPQAKMMGYMFPLMMTVLLANVAAGLNLYYAVQNIAALPQQWLLARARKKA